MYALFIADLQIQCDIDACLFADDTAFMANSIQHSIATKMKKAFTTATETSLNADGDTDDNDQGNNLRRLDANFKERCAMSEHLTERSLAQA